MARLKLMKQSSECLRKKKSFISLSAAIQLKLKGKKKRLWVKVFITAVNIWLRTQNSNFSYFFKCWITAGLVSTGLSVTKMTKPTSSLPKAHGDEIISFCCTGRRIQQGMWLAPGRKCGLQCLPFMSAWLFSSEQRLTLKFISAQELEQDVADCYDILRPVYRPSC